MNGKSNAMARVEPTIDYRFVSSLCGAVNEEMAREGMQRFGLQYVDGEVPRLSFRRYVDLFEWFALQSSNPYLGLQLSQQFGPEALGAIGYLFLSSRTLEMAIRNLGNHLRALQDSTSLFLGVDGSFAHVHYEVLDSRITRRRQDSECSLGSVWHFMNLFSGGICRLTMVEFEHDRPEDNDAAYQRVFSAPALFGRRFNRLHFRAEHLAIQSDSGDPNLFPIIEQQVQSLVSNVVSIESFVDQVRARLTPDALGNRMRARAIAAQLGISETTLYRRLNSEGQTFKGLHDEAAKSYARYLIAQKTLQIGTIARRLGFADTACLTRAFYRWFNVCPSEFRRSL